MSCLYIFEINSLSVASFAIIFSHYEGCLFNILIVSFVVQNFLSLIKSHLFLLSFPLLWEVGHRRSYCGLCQRVFCLCFYEQVLNATRLWIIAALLPSSCWLGYKISQIHLTIKYSTWAGRERHHKDNSRVPIGPGTCIIISSLSIILNCHWEIPTLHGPLNFKRQVLMKLFICRQGSCRRKYLLKPHLP